MGFGTTVLLSFAAGAILLLGGGLIMYMSNLIKAGYDLKIQITNEVEERLTKMTEELDKKSRWIKRDLLEEIEKIRTAMQTDNMRRFEDLSEPMKERLNQLNMLLQSEHEQWLSAVTTDRQLLTAMDTRTKAITKQLKKLEELLSPDVRLAMSGEAASTPAAPPAPIPETPAPAAEAAPVADTAPDEAAQAQG